MALRSAQTLTMDDQEKVELFISCRKLKNMDYFSLTDPQVKLFIEKNGQFIFFDKTEMISDNLNPNFTKSFILDYYFEVKQKLKFEIIDIDGPNQSEFVGEVHTTLGEIIGSKNNTAIFDIIAKGNKTGKLVVTFEKVARNASSVFLEFNGHELKNVEGLFGKSNPVLKLCRAAGDSGYVVVYETELIKKNLNPFWKAFEIKVQKLCNSDYYRPIKAEVYSRSGYKETLIGEAQFTLSELKDQEMRSFTLNHPKKGKHGTLKLSQFAIVEKPDFLDYLAGGVQLSVILAIDFTGSNGHPRFDDSLHAIRYDGRLNEYQKAIYGVCDILLNYDYDKKIPAYGFGGKPRFPAMSSNIVSHCFPMTGDPSNPWCFGLEGIMGTYAAALQNVELSGPTLFAPILQQAMQISQQNKMQGSNEYTILLIITDGEIHDMEPTINCLIKSAELPLSVIIIGVGGADFANMEILDGDEGLTNSQGTKAQRDLVQFVPFRSFGGNQEELARRVLEEVPDQLVEYMTKVGIKPRPAERVDMSKVFNKQATLIDHNMVVQEEYKQFEAMPDIRTSQHVRPPNFQGGPIGGLPGQGGPIGGLPGQVGPIGGLQVQGGPQQQPGISQILRTDTLPQNVQLNFQQQGNQSMNYGQPGYGAPQNGPYGGQGGYYGGSQHF